MVVVENEQLTIYEIEKFYKKILQEFRENEAVEIDLSKVKKVDLSLIQLLLSLKKSEKKVSLKLSDNAKEMLKEFGVSIKD